MPKSLLYYRLTIHLGQNHSSWSHCHCKVHLNRHVIHQNHDPCPYCGPFHELQPKIYVLLEVSHTLCLTKNCFLTRPSRKRFLNFILSLILWKCIQMLVCSGLGCSFFKDEIIWKAKMVQWLLFCIQCGQKLNFLIIYE